MKKSWKVFYIASVSVLACALAAVLILQICEMSHNRIEDRKVSKFIDDQLERQAADEEQENEYVENGFLVGGFEIRDTSQISDAYKNKDDSGLSDEDKETLKMASDVIDKVVKDGMSNYEKELAVYEWMCDNIGKGESTVITMPGGSMEFTPYGVLKNRNAVCVGYATTFRLFMNMLGINVHVVHSDEHSWDLVEVEEGQWYHVDIYFDSGVGSNRYSNFNMTDEVAKISHTWEETDLPAATATKYSYAVQSAVTVRNVYEVPKQVKKLLKKEKGSLFFRFKEKIDKDNMPIADYMVGQMNMAISLSGMENISLSGIWYPDGKGEYILGLFLCKYDDAEATAFDENSKEAVKLQKEISKAFGVDLSEANSMDGSMEGDI